jgi:hypothetical protein
VQSLVQITAKGGGSTNELKKNKELAVGAVIGEPVSTSYFPVSRVNTGKFWCSRPVRAM